MRDPSHSTLAYILVLNYFTELETSPIFVSNDPASNAMIRPVPAGSLSRERCPSDICKVKRARKGMLWVMCDTCRSGTMLAVLD